VLSTLICATAETADDGSKSLWLCHSEPALADDVMVAFIITQSYQQQTEKIRKSRVRFLFRFVSVRGCSHLQIPS
jgi:hypothetical protein